MIPNLVTCMGVEQNFKAFKYAYTQASEPILQVRLMRSIYNVFCRSKSNTEIISSICFSNAQVSNSFDVQPNLINPSTASKKTIHAKNGRSNAKVSSPTHLVDGVRTVKKTRLSKAFTIPERITVSDACHVEIWHREDLT